MNELSIIMCVYNSEKFLSKAIESILNQTLKNYEFLILDDCSTDNSYKILKKYDQKDKRIKLFKNENNLGFTKSLNKIISFTTTNYILKMDSDDISHPERAEKLFGILKTKSDIAMVSSGYKKIDKGGNIISTHINVMEPKLILEGLLGVNIICSAFIFNKLFFKEVNGFDEKYKYAQDYDFELKISERWKIYNIPEILYSYRVHDDAISLKHSIERTEIDNEIRRDALKRISEEDRSKRPLPNIRYLKKKYGIWKLAFIFNDFGCHYMNHGMYKLAKREFKISFKINPFNIKTLFYLLIKLNLEEIKNGNS